MPKAFADLAVEAAGAADFDGFRPDACLVNRYAPGARLSLHQDRNERNFDQPIVSVSLGLPAIFLWGGQKRTDQVRRVPVAHGDVVVWGARTV
jgi:alkylated DNA repair protein (DNA oxidative demethylase)